MSDELALVSSPSQSPQGPANTATTAAPVQGQVADVQAFID